MIVSKTSAAYKIQYGLSKRIAVYAIHITSRSSNAILQEEKIVFIFPLTEGDVL
jgi:hypothetical protein